MKRIVFLSLFIILLGGCQLFAPASKTAEEVVDEEPLVKFTGIVERSDQLFPVATHLLKTDDGKELKLFSGIVKLRKYEKRRVEIEAKKKDSDVYSVEHVTALGREEENRELYRNVRLGISAQINILWELTEKATEVSSTPYAAEEGELVDRITMARTTNEKKLEPKKWLDLDENLLPRDPKDDAFYSNVVVGPDRLSGIKRTSKDGSSIDFFVSRENFMYVLSHVSLKDEDADKYRTVFFDLINSFQFLPIVASDFSSLSTAPIPDETPLAAPAPEQSATSEIPEGFALMQSERWKIQMLYPKNWHWSRFENGYAFGEKEVNTKDDIILNLDRFSAFPETQFGRTNVTEDRLMTQNMECRKIQQGEIYCLSWLDHYNQPGPIGEMLSSIKLRPSLGRP